MSIFYKYKDILYMLSIMVGRKIIKRITDVRKLTKE